MGACEHVGHSCIYYEHVWLLHFCLKIRNAEWSRKRQFAEQWWTLEVVFFHFSEVPRHNQLFTLGAFHESILVKLEVRVGFPLVSQRADFRGADISAANAARAMSRIDDNVVAQR